MNIANLKHLQIFFNKQTTATDKQQITCIRKIKNLCQNTPIIIIIPQKFDPRNNEHYKIHVLTKSDLIIIIVQRGEKQSGLTNNNIIFQRVDFFRQFRLEYFGWTLKKFNTI